MRRFLERFAYFMQGRYGNDALNNFIAVSFLIIWAVNIFVFNFTATIVLDLIMLGLIALMLFRSFSKNINARLLENRRFLKIFNAVKSFFTLNQKKFRERKEFKYIKCPHCKAQLRVKRQKGNHTVRCPRCKSEFKTKI